MKVGDLVELQNESFPVNNGKRGKIWRVNTLFLSRPHYDVEMESVVVTSMDGHSTFEVSHIQRPAYNLRLISPLHQLAEQLEETDEVR